MVWGSMHGSLDAQAEQCSTHDRESSIDVTSANHLGHGSMKTEPNSSSCSTSRYSREPHCDQEQICHHGWWPQGDPANSASNSETDKGAREGNHWSNQTLLLPVSGKWNIGASSSRLVRLDAYSPTRIRSWLALSMFVLRLLVFASVQVHHVQGVQPMLGASLSWAVNRKFHQMNTEQDRTVTFTLRSAFRMARKCNYTLFQNVSCSLSPDSQKVMTSDKCQDRTPEGVCKNMRDAKAVSAGAILSEHGVLCVGQVIRTPLGTLELIYAPALSLTSPDTDRSLDTCAHDASQAVKTRLLNGSYVTEAPPRKMLGKVNSFLVTSLHHNDSDSIHSTLAIDRRLNGMDVAVGVLVHTGERALRCDG
jgi:hypothetical protein